MAPGKEGAWINQLLVSPVFSPPARLLRHDVNTHSVDTKHPEQGQRGAGPALLFAQHPTRAEQTSRRCFSGPPPPTQPQLLQVLANAHTCALHGKLALGGGEAWDVVATPQPLAFCKKLPLWGQLSPGGPHGVRLRLDVFLPLPAASSQLSGELSLREPHARGPVSGRLQHSHLLSLFIKSWG